MAVSGVNFATLSIKTKDASKFGISDSGLEKINTDGNDVITGAELKATGFAKYPALTNHFNKISNGAILGFQGNVDGAQRVAQVGNTNPTAPANNFVKQTFAFSNSTPNNPEHRDYTNGVLGDPILGKGLYLLG